MNFLDLIPVWLQLILFPVIVLGLWTLLFNSQNTVFTSIVVEGGYLVIAVPIIIITFLSIPMLALVFWASQAGLAREVTTIFGITLGLITIIIEYFYIKKIVKNIEEREQMPIWDYIKRAFDPKYQESIKLEKLATKEDAIDFFDEITEMNKKKREIDRDEKEKLRRALLGEMKENE